MPIVLNDSVPSSVLKKKRNSIAFHGVRETIAARRMSFGFVKSEENFSDILVKPLNNGKFHYLMKR
jgi:hypothetical protein